MTSPADAPPSRGSADEPPPFWTGWSRIYGFVAGLLLLQTMLFALLTWWAS